MKIILPFFLLFTLLNYEQVLAQEPMMAEHNMAISVMYGLSNAHAIDLNLKSISGSNYSKQFSKPVSICYEYSIKDDFTLGAVLHFFNYDLKEENTTDSMKFRMKGRQIGLSARAVRYVLHRPRMMTYVFVNAGLRFRQQEFSSETQDVFNTSSFPGSHFDSSRFKPYSLEAGLGTKFLITRRVGLGAEVGVINAIFQTGLCYLFLESSRKTKDTIGW